MRRVFQILRDTEQGFSSYVWKAALIALVPNLVLAFSLAVVIPDAEHPEFVESPIGVIVGLLVISPWIETLLMWPILKVLKFFTSNLRYVVLASGLVWAVIHSIIVPTWGLTVFWSFIVFSICFLEWQKQSTRKAIAVTAATHTCVNILPCIAVIATGG